MSGIAQAVCVNSAQHGYTALEAAGVALPWLAAVFKKWYKQRQQVENRQKQRQQLNLCCIDCCASSAMYASLGGQVDST
jgi:hypothetical protein